VIIDTESVVSAADAAADFSRVMRLVDTTGVAVIFKNDAPRYIVTKFSVNEREQSADDEDVMRMAVKNVKKHRHAFEQL